MGWETQMRIYGYSYVQILQKDIAAMARYVKNIGRGVLLLVRL